MSEVAELKKRVVILNPTRMGLAEQLRQDWVVTAEQGTTQEDVLDPIYWTHMAEKMKPFDKIEVRIDDGSWMMELVVLAAERNYAKVEKLHSYELAKVDVKNESTKHYVEYKGPHRKHVVIRKADQQVIKEGISSKNEAHLWIREHEKIT